MSCSSVASSRSSGIMSDIRNPVAAAALDAIDTAYGHGRIPIGVVADSSANTAPHGYSDVLAEELPHTIRNSSQAQPAVDLYRRLLAAQPNHSVTVVALGGDTNLAGLLRSGPGQGSSLRGRALVATKVKKLVIEDGLFPTGGPPFTNEKLDIAATKSLVARGGGWPTAIAWVDGLTGISTKVGGTLCTSVPPKNPMRIVYTKLFHCGPPGDGDWDGPTMLYAVEGATADLLRPGSGRCCGHQQQGRIVLGTGTGASAGGLRPCRKPSRAQREDQRAHRKLMTWTKATPRRRAGPPGIELSSGRTKRGVGRDDFVPG